MSTLTATTPKTARVSINSWMYSREVEILPNQVGLQVTVPSCDHCPTCQRRVREFTRTLDGKPSVIHQWKSGDDGATWLYLPRTRQQDPLDLLRRVLEIRIHAH